VRSSDVGHGEQGMAVIVAMLALVLLSLVVAGTMATINGHLEQASHQVRSRQAFIVAEAGMAEARNRILAGDVPDNDNPLMVARIVSSASGTVPQLGPDSIAIASSPSVGARLPRAATGELTVSYKTNAARTQIYRYSPSSETNVHLGGTGLSIFAIRSTGGKDGDRVTVLADVMRRPFSLDVRAALAARGAIRIKGGATVCGRNHRIDTPPGSRVPACAAAHVETDPLPGLWSGDAIVPGPGRHDGVPPIRAFQSGVHDGPWESLGMSQAGFFPWIGAPRVTEPDPPVGLVYLDDDLTPQNAHGDWAYHGGRGEGMLYADGNLRLDDFTFVGLIEVEGDLTLAGNVWILGAVVVRGTVTFEPGSRCAVLWSADALQQKISRYGGELVTLSRREER
jgi:hypothetical protein